jgi:DNA-binding NarL/FixJ family response regulator
MMDHPSPTDLLTRLLETLDLLTAQARAYERSLPGDNYPARAVVANMGELARQALVDARALSAANPPAAPVGAAPSGTRSVPSPAANPCPLSARETEVLALIAQGQTNREIAYHLGISARTVQFHLNSIFNKTATASRTEAATLAVRQGWIAG